MTNSFKLISWENTLSEYEHKSVAATFACQLEDLDRQCPDASNFLRVLAFLDPESIPLEMLTKGAKLISESQRLPLPHTGAQVGLKRRSFISIIQNKLLRRRRAIPTSQCDEIDAPPDMPPTSTALLALIQDPIDLRHTLTHLQDRSLVAIQHNSQSSTLRIHDLVQLVVLETMKGSRAYCESFELAVDLACSAMRQLEVPSFPFFWLPQCEPLVPHIQSLTQEQETSTRAKRQLLLANQCRAWCLVGRGRYVEAEQLCRRLLAENERFFGAGDLDTFNVMNNLGWIYIIQGRFSDAEPLFDRVLRTRKERFGSKHRDTLISSYRLAVVYNYQHRYYEAEDLLKRTLLIQQRQFGSEDFDTLDTMYELASVHCSQQRYGDAELIFKTLLSAHTNIFGSEHSNVFSTMHELACVYDLQQRHDDAEELFTQLLLGKEKIYGSGHPETLTTQHCLARVYFARSRSLEAAALLVNVLARRQEILGDSHPYTQDTISLLACVYEDLGRSADAAALRQRLVPSSS